jgi:transcriptional regulator with PAS, ATPase and Fis domain
MSPTKQKTLKLRILVLDDEISSASSFIFNEMVTSCFQDEEIRDFSLTTLQGKESQEFHLIPSLNLGEGATTVSFTCNLPSKKSVFEVKKDITEHIYSGEFDLVLLDDNWGERRHGGQDELMGLVYKHIRGEVDGLPVIALFTQHWEEDRIKHLFEVAREFEGAPVIPVNKTDPLQIITLIWRALVLKQALRQKKKAMDIARELEIALEVLGDDDVSFESIVGSSRAIRQVFRGINLTAPLTTSVTLIGESGTGKELVAREIHKNSPRATQPFIAVNCAAIPESMAETELFGHDRGAFTDAREEHHGAFERASGGTLFLDEIGELSLPVQAKLLRALQEKAITRVGGKKLIDTDVRLIVATNSNLKEAKETGRFRKDLYYRIYVFDIKIPPLRERKGDIKLLAEHFAREFSQKHSRPLPVISDIAMAALNAYYWPGNVRELENAIEVAVVSCNGNEILLGNLRPEIVSNLSPSAIGPSIASKSDAYWQAFEACKDKKVVTNKIDKEYQLLHLIFSKAGEAPTDNELLAVGWPRGSGDLRQAIVRLRKKMKNEGINWTIAHRTYEAKFVK